MQIFKIENGNGKISLRVLGIRVFKLINIDTTKEFYLFDIKIFSLVDTIKKLNDNHFKLTKLINSIPSKQDLIDEIRFENCVMSTHSKTFPQFEGINKGKDVAIVGTGPTLNFYNFNENFLHVGLNRAFKSEKVRKLDYTFFIHYSDTSREYAEELSNYDCIKFFGRYKRDKIISWNIPNYIADKPNVYRYYITRDKIAPELDCNPLFDAGSVAFSAIHFSLYTHPKRLFLIGCDTSMNGYYDKNVTQVKWLGLNDTIKNYPRIKEFADIYYPDVEIISVNPVGLRGLFRDVYTKDYVANNPELFKGVENNVEIYEDIL